MKKKSIIVLGVFLIFTIACVIVFFLGNGRITIKFDSNGGVSVKSIEIKKGEKISLPKTTKDGFVFNGWYLENTKVSDDTTYDKDTTLKANWLKENAKTFTVNFDSDGGTKVESITLECNKELNLPKAPTKDGYEFLSWIDKNGTPIYDKALLVCEDINLKANWLKEEPQKTVDNTNIDKNKESESKEPAKVYTCPSGYTLKENKCIAEDVTKEKCPDGTRQDGSTCIKLNDYVKGTRKCKTETVILDNNGHTWTGEGEYYEAGLGICGYYVWTGVKTKSECDALTQKNKQWSNNKCYAKVINNNYENAGCPDSYKYYSSSDLQSKFGAYNNGGCYKEISLEKYCSDGWTLSNDKCTKVIDATLK